MRLEATRLEKSPSLYCDVNGTVLNLTVALPLSGRGRVTQTSQGKSQSYPLKRGTVHNKILILTIDR